MTRRWFSDLPSLIADLLDRHEKNPDATRLIATIDNDGFEDLDRRDAFGEELARLEREGGVERVWTGHRAGLIVTGVRLKDAAVLYRQTGRKPSAQLVDGALAELRAYNDLPIGAVPLIDAVANAWRRGVAHIGIAKGDVRTLDQVIRLATAVHARAAEQPEGEIDYRTFSRLAVSDSKALERNTRPVASAIARLFPTAASPAQRDPEELLAEAGIVRLPQPVLLRGSIGLKGQPLPELPFVGFPTECAEFVDLLNRPSYVLTIENYASFMRYVREVSQTDEGLVIYSAGFPSGPTLKAIARLAALADAPTFHWGDMDAGGVRIFRHIETHLAPLGVTLRPHMMEAELLRRTGAVMKDVHDGAGDMAGSAISDLALIIHQQGLAQEQEEFSPRSPLANVFAAAQPATDTPPQPA